MNKNSTIEGRDLSDVLQSFEGDTAGYRRAFEAIAQEIPCAQVLLITTFPRCGTQILQPAHYPEGLLRAYTKGLFTEDGPTWQALLRRAPVTGNDAAATGKLEGSVYFQKFMQPLGWAHVAAARLPGPIFKGYPGAIHLYR